jgi:chaperonin GroEL
MDNREDVDERVSELKEQLKTTTKKSMAQHLRSRIASLSGSIGQIYVGADTENERKERHDRVDDAVCAVRSALESGVIPGGGVITLALSTYMGDMEAFCEDTDRKIAYGILRKGLLRPFIQIMENAGENPFVIGDKITESTDEHFRYGYNLMSYSYGDMIEMGVIDPTKVTKEAIRNAISVASTILNTSVVVTQERAIG